jgi:endonuclease III related protein
MGISTGISTGVEALTPPKSQIESAAAEPAPILAEPNAASPAPTLQAYFKVMSAQMGPMKWWRAKNSFEVIVGAILVQNTAWKNVKLALINLHSEKLLTPRAIAKVSTARLQRLIRSSGYFRQKAKKLKVFVKFLDENYRGSLKRMFAAPTDKLREQLLAVHGIGPETADSILLYAGGHAVFVVDAYTKRLLARHGLMREDAKYDEVQAFFERHLPRDAKLFNEYHALIVNVGKNWCRKREALCAECPLEKFLPEVAAEARGLVTIGNALESAR